MFTNVNKAEMRYRDCLYLTKCTDVIKTLLKCMKKHYTYLLILYLII